MEIIRQHLRMLVIELIRIITWIYDNAWDVVGPIVIIALQWLLRRLLPSW